MNTNMILDEKMGRYVRFPAEEEDEDESDIISRRERERYICMYCTIFSNSRLICVDRIRHETNK